MSMLSVAMVEEGSEGNMVEKAAAFVFQLLWFAVDVFSDRHLLYFLY